MSRKKKQPNRVYVTGTKDRLYLKERYDGIWVLIDRRGNYYASAKEPQGIYEQVEGLVGKGICELR